MIETTASTLADVMESTQNVHCPICGPTGNHLWHKLAGKILDVSCAGGAFLAVCRRDKPLVP